VTAITIFTEGLGYHPHGEELPRPRGVTVTSSTLATKFGRLLISTLPLVVLLTMLSTVTDGQVIDKERSVKPQAKAISPKSQAKDISVKPQAKDTSGRPQAKANSVKPQAKANAPSLLAPSDVPSQKMIRTGDTGAVDIVATSGSYRLVTGSQGERSYQINTPSGALSLRIGRVPALRCPELHP
jgi:hypothetical protein